MSDNKWIVTVHGEQAEALVDEVMSKHSTLKDSRVSYAYVNYTDKTVTIETEDIPVVEVNWNADDGTGTITLDGKTVKIDSVEFTPASEAR